MHGNLMNGKEVGSIKLLKLEYRSGAKIIQTFWRIGAPQNLGPHSSISRNFKTLRKVVLNHEECIKM